MADTNDEAPSFLQAALAETVHREHTEHIDNLGNKHTHARFHQRRAHVHDAHVHQRQEESTVTAVVHTVSVVQQVAVDGEGNTISVSTSTYSANTANTAMTSDNGGSRATAAPVAPAPTGDGPGDGATAAPAVPEPVPADTGNATSQPQPTEPPTTILPTEIPTEIPTDTVPPALPEPTATSLPDIALPNTTAAPVPSFSSLTAVNGTGTAKGSLGVPVFLSLHNNTATSRTLSGVTSTSIRHKYGGGGAYESVYTDAYGNVYTTSLTTSSAGATGTGTIYGAPGSDIGTGSGSDTGTGAGTDNPTGDEGSGSSNSDSKDPPPTPVVVGSVVGSLAGVTLVAFLIMLLLRWKRRQQGGVQLGNGRDLTSPDIPSGGATSGPMAMVRRASLFTVPAALAGFTGQNRKSQATNFSAADSSQRSFVRVSGRKLPSVLTSGGNGYEDPFSDRQQDPFADPHLSDTSFYRDSRGFYGGIGLPATPTSAGLPSSPLNDKAPRSPAMGYQAHISAESGTGPLINVNASPPLPRPDALGRSHPSRDGSRNSRFTEEV